MKKSLILLLGISLVFVACDKVDDPFEGITDQSFQLDGDVEYIVDDVFGIGDTSELRAFIDDNEWTEDASPDNDNQRFIVLEEFTGHKCTFCPDGTREIVRLDQKFGAQLIPIGIHAGTFAIPEPGGGVYSTDFRVPNGDGETYESTFNVAGYPSGIVSRIGSNASGLATWEPTINGIKDETPKAKLIMTGYYSSAVNAVRAQIEITWKEDLPEDYSLQVFLVEDNIVDYQLDNGVIKPDYLHRHVLRKVVNSTFGKSLEKAESGEEVKIQYIFPSNLGWKPDDLEVVAFIFNGDPNSYEIIQANAVHVK